MMNAIKVLITTFMLVVLTGCSATVTLGVGNIVSCVNAESADPACHEDITRQPTLVKPQGI